MLLVGSDLGFAATELNFSCWVSLEWVNAMHANIRIKLLYSFLFTVCVFMHFVVFSLHLLLVFFYKTFGHDHAEAWFWRDPHVKLQNWWRNVSCCIALLLLAPPHWGRQPSDPSFLVLQMLTPLWADVVGATPHWLCENVFVEVRHLETEMSDEAQYPTLVNILQ